MKCPKCESEIINVTKDSRGIPEARCAECGSYIKKLGAAEAVDHFEKKIAQLKDAGSYYTSPEQLKEQEDDRMPCKYCTEFYFIRRGRLGTTYIPVEIKYCPMCGRKRKETDTKY